ncbi:MAG TPA: HisA/HisF-related TIM barrel protein, partial [Stellaceae bacterium]|nr:HisA/HisF-related TIM barrel protein [Stellaceae bacterium]
MTDRFQIIPVLDLKAGHVVHARAGDRANYHPIRSPLVAGSAPLEVLRALLALAPISTLYIADLDAIAKTGDHRATLAELARQHPKLTFWYDGGGLPLEEAVPVLGSESLSQRAELQAAMAKWGPENFILSLD